jgi:CDP-diacylglycerol---serine O-phosphatidyltransferase
VFVSVIFFIALLISYPWHILSAGSLLYLASLPMGWKSYRDHANKAAVASAPPAEVTAAGPAPSYPAVTGTTAPEEDRPERLH